MRLTSATFPTLAQLHDGLGEIVLGLEGDVPGGGASRRLVFENHHDAQMSAYLVNCLVPSDPNFHVAAQDRNYEQSFYQLDYTDAGPASTTAPRPTWSDRVWAVEGFFYHGIRHILTGYDHLLFVGALALGVRTLWDLIKVVSTFTLAQTITLTLAAFGLVHVSSRVVEPLIAASIVFVAVQNVMWPGRTAGRSRLAVAFFFGLFHGLGFAGGLLDAMRELHGTTMITAIVAFSVGVEVGHQLVVSPLFAFLKAVRRTQTDAPARQHRSLALQQFGSAGISIAGTYYLFFALMP